MKILKRTVLWGLLFVLLLGTLSHFFFEWSHENFFVGLFSPVSESIWEHMKLLFFPMLLYSLAAVPVLKPKNPCVSSGFAAGILSGTLLIPVLYYTYTGILGFHTLFLDIGCFILAAVLGFFTVFRLSCLCRLQDCARFLWILVLLLAVCFLLLTYAPPALELFADPALGIVG